MVFVVKKLREKGSNFIIYNLLIFSDECIANFINKHIKRIYSFSKAATLNTCIIDIHKHDVDADNFSIAMPNTTDVERCLYDAVIDMVMPLKIPNKTLINLPISSAYNYLKGREFQKNDRLKILEPADLILFDFMFSITITEIMFYDNFKALSKELIKKMGLTKQKFSL